jgi:hypothetical protein
MTSALVRTTVVASLLVSTALPAVAETRVVHTPRGSIVYDDQFHDRNYARLSELPAREFFERQQEND